jgi:hypothetical protein
LVNSLLLTADANGADLDPLTTWLYAIDGHTNQFRLLRPNLLSCRVCGPERSEPAFGERRRRDSSLGFVCGAQSAPPLTVRAAKPGGTPVRDGSHT